MADISKFRIAMIAAEWHGDLVKKATDACRLELLHQGVKEPIDYVTVPGSLELPLAAKLAAHTGKWDAVMVFGLIVDGGIYRHEFVAQAVIDGIVNVSLATQTPIISTVLTPQEFNASDPKHNQFFSKHLVKKGIESAVAAVKTIIATQKLRS